MSDLKSCPFCGEIPSIMSTGMAGQPRWQHPVNDTCPIAGHYLGGWDFPVQWNRRALPAAQPDPREAALRDIARQKKTDEMDTEYDVEYADFEGGYNAIIDVARRALPAVQPAHVNETPKSEHDARDMLTPATGDA